MTKYCRKLSAKCAFSVLDAGIKICLNVSKEGTFASAIGPLRV